MEASAPLAPHIEPEPSGWQPRAIWLSARLFCGSATFFFVSFVFAYFYLRAIDSNHAWKIGHVDPSIGFGVAIALLLALSAVVFRVGATRPTDTFRAGVAAVVMALAAVALQCIQYTTLKFGPASGGYASVFVGWTALQAFCTLGCVYWMETQVASVWRARREGLKRPVPEGVPADDVALMRAGIEACSFFWSFFVGIALIAFVILYVI